MPDQEFLAAFNKRVESFRGVDEVFDYVLESLKDSSNMVFGLIVHNKADLDAEIASSDNDIEVLRKKFYELYDSNKYGS